MIMATDLQTLQELLATVRDDMLTHSNVFPFVAADINNGLCADFATAVWKEFPQVRIVSDDGMGPYRYSHTFLEYEDLYYDAECIEGEEDWTQLPIFQRNGLED